MQASLGFAGYLIAREYTETVALRRMSPADARRLTKDNLPTVWAAGTAVALALNVPLLNLVAPILGVAAFTHLYHGSRSART